MEELLKVGSASTRALCATLLGSDSDLQSLEQLHQALADRDWAVRIAAIKAVTARSSRDSIPKLEPLLADDKEAVRYASAAAILRLTTPKPPARKNGGARAPKR